MAVMGWAMLYLFLFLKLPVAALLYLVWWAIRQNTDVTPVTAGGEDGGSPDDGGGDPAGDDSPGSGGHPHDGWDRLPRRSRRGPHDEPQPAAPARVRPPELPERERDPHRPHA